MNLANKLTVSRFVLAPLVLIFLLLDNVYAKYLALILFAIASLTDLLDGRIARSHNIVTAFGKFMDPLADKILVAGALVAFVAIGEIPAWMVIVILAREFAITGLRLQAASQGTIIPAGRWGKHKTISQLVAVNATLLIIVFKSTLAHFFGHQISSEPWGWLLANMPDGLMLIAVIMTIISGLIYIRIHRKFLGERGNEGLH
jgi:CDP-diacylglycerol--glycerol-3-phosphate 3-phosphatidyltransferase